MTYNNKLDPVSYEHITWVANNIVQKSKEKLDKEILEIHEKNKKLTNKAYFCYLGEFYGLGRYEWAEPMDHVLHKSLHERMNQYVKNKFELKKDIYVIKKWLVEAVRLSADTYGNTLFPEGIKNYFNMLEFKRESFAASNFFFHTKYEQNLIKKYLLKNLLIK